MRVAAKAKRLSRRMLEQCTVLFTPDTILEWFRKLIAEKYDGSQHRTSPGRPRITEEIVNLVIKFKEENPRWGYKKIRDQIVYLNYKISNSSVKNILIENGYNPEPDLTVRSTWHEFLRSHWDVLAACDFFHHRASGRPKTGSLYSLLRDRYCFTEGLFRTHQAPAGWRVHETSGPNISRL